MRTSWREGEEKKRGVTLPHPYCVSPIPTPLVNKLTVARCVRVCVFEWADFCWFGAHPGARRAHGWPRRWCVMEWTGAGRAGVMPRPTAMPISYSDELLGKRKLRCRWSRSARRVCVCVVVVGASPRSTARVWRPPCARTLPAFPVSARRPRTCKTPSRPSNAKGSRAVTPSAWQLREMHFLEGPAILSRRATHRVCGNGVALVAPPPAARPVPSPHCSRHLLFPAKAETIRVRQAGQRCDSAGQGRSPPGLTQARARRAAIGCHRDRTAPTANPIERG